MYFKSANVTGLKFEPWSAESIVKTSVVEIICGVELFSLSESKLLGLTIDSHRTIEVHRAAVV